MRKFSLFFAVLVCAFSFSFAQIQILVNVVGYEKSGAKRAVIRSSSSIADGEFTVIDARNNVVFTASLGHLDSVKGWSGHNFRVADFSDFDEDGEYRLKVGTATSLEFAIGKKILQEKTGPFQVSFFNEMRNTDERDRNLAIRGGGTHNIYGGWWDATGDPGKHLSHLSYANYFNPQQIPLVVWALLQANEFQPDVFSTAAKAEAAWGADYLLRSLSDSSYFYMSVFDNWGGWGEGTRQICAWSGQDGDRSTDYQSAMREGGGMSIAALARASKAGISDASKSAAYLDGAKRAYAHLKAYPTKYQDNGKENIIDDYTGLLAASELCNATKEPEYRIDAQARAASLLARQSGEGWFYTHKDNGQNERPFYHAADEGLPVVALARYAEVCDSSDVENIRRAIRKNFQWYINITYQESNPFEYVKMYGSPAATGQTAMNLALGSTPTASQSEAGFPPEKAIDGGPANDSRWSSYKNGEENDNQWLALDLGEVYRLNKVVLIWERAFGKSYDIEISLNGTGWSRVAGESNNASEGRKEYTFPATDARYVRMFGRTRDLEYGGFSLYEFEVYGEQQQSSSLSSVRFFMPHTNETGYWWQGENARIASLSAAFTMGAQLADPSGELWYDTLFAIATAQLDWILGKNPFAASMMHGFGPSSYPNYPSEKEHKDNIKGGICNGITAKGDSKDSDLEWSNGSSTDNWRWIEQWLPHNAWYLTAISALSHRIDNPIEPPAPIRKSNFAKSNFRISVVNGRNVNVELPFAADNRTNIDIYNMRGQKLFSYNVPAGNLRATVEMPSHIKHGAYILSVKNMAGKTGAGGFIFGK